MDLEGHYLQNTISHALFQMKLRSHCTFLQRRNFCNARDKGPFILGNIYDCNVFVNFSSFLNVLLFWFHADQGLKKVNLIPFFKVS